MEISTISTVSTVPVISTVAAAASSTAPQPAVLVPDQPLPPGED